MVQERLLEDTSERVGLGWLRRVLGNVDAIDGWLSESGGTCLNRIASRVKKSECCLNQHKWAYLLCETASLDPATGAS